MGPSLRGYDFEIVQTLVTITGKGGEFLGCLPKCQRYSKAEFNGDSDFSIKNGLIPGSDLVMGVQR